MMRLKGGVTFALIIPIFLILCAEVYADHMPSYASDEEIIKSTLNKCWSIDHSIYTASHMHMVLHVEMDPEANVRKIEVVRRASVYHPRDRIMFNKFAQATVKAIKSCGPYHYLSPQNYSKWQKMDIQFALKEFLFDRK